MIAVLITLAICFADVDKIFKENSTAVVVVVTYNGKDNNMGCVPLIFTMFSCSHFSKIVKECRIGKNKAKEYFEFLIEKGLVECRTDGYRKFYRVRD